MSVTTHFSATPENGSERITLLRNVPSRIPLRKKTSEAVAFEDWILHRPPGSGAALGRLLQSLEDDKQGPNNTPLIAAEATAARLHPAFVAALSDAEAESLGLPPATRLALDLRSHGLLHKPGFRVETRWVRLGGVPAHASIEGTRLHHDGKTWRIPEPIFSTLRFVDAINAAVDESAAQAALSQLRREIGDNDGDHISMDGFIQRLRIAYASGFSLSLKETTRGFDFDPILFSPERCENPDDEVSPDEMSDSLLPPIMAADFARRFRLGDGRRRSYLLDDGSMLFIDEQLVRALHVVREAQSGSTEQRRAFARNPRRAIEEALGTRNDDTAETEHLFIETQQFSERVAGIDIWRKPVLSWIKPQSNSWLPEAFGLSIGTAPNETVVSIGFDQIHQVKESAEFALHESRSSFRFGDIDIPATQQTYNALCELADIVRPQSEQLDEPVNDADAPSRQGPYFLRVRDNLDEVGFELTHRFVRNSDTSQPDLPTTLRTTPKPHQKVGFDWLVSCWKHGMPGALLADDMGLGKTFQALAFLAWIRAQEPHSKPILIVAPTGLLANWRSEIERHLQPGTLGNVVNAYGVALKQVRSGSARDIEIGDSSINLDDWARAGVVLTTYETMRDYHLSFGRLKFAAIVYDEVQKLKNPASQMTCAAKTLHAQIQIAMTGTPVENSLQDLWSIIDVIHPGRLGSSRAFDERYPADKPERLKELHALLTEPQHARPSLLLRRMKDDHLPGLPKKTVRTMPTDMPPAQRAAYDHVIHRGFAAKESGEPGRMLEVLQNLRGVSLHPLDPDQASSEDVYFEQSARTATLFRLLHEIAGKKEKVLIFCESLAMQALLAAEIRRRFALDYPVPRIHGGVAGDNRQAAVEAFQRRGAGFDAMILSPKAGGVGLTLTAANHVVHLSRWWNPAVEDQATDRAYRIGQTRDVTVYLPQSVHPDATLAPASFDLKLHELMERKRRLSQAFLAPGENENDATELFDAVIVDRTRSLTPETAIPPEPAQPTRSILSLGTKRLPMSAPSDPSPSRMKFGAKKQRDFAIFQHPLRDDPAVDLRIVDPYAAAKPRNRDYLLTFMTMLCGERLRSLQNVQLYTFDAESIETIETTSEQHAELQRIWVKQFGERPSLTHVQKSKRQSPDMHDREIRVRTRSGRVLYWDLGHGIDGLMSLHHACTVTFTEEPRAASA